MFQWIAAFLFLLAICHTFLAFYVEKLAHRWPEHGGVFHLLGEVEAVFGSWALIMLVTMCIVLGGKEALGYLDGCNFTEPMFVFAIMVIAGSKPILNFAASITRLLAKLLPLPGSVSFYVVSLSFIPLLGSFITEPAAMTLAALLLRDMFFSKGISTRLKYATIGVLFVNISIGGVLTPFAAPPVLMVAGKWGWDITFMITTFGWRAILAVLTNAILVTLIFQKELRGLKINTEQEDKQEIPHFVTAAHLFFLVGVVVFVHHPAVFMGLMLFFLGFATAYKRYQDRLILREGLMVAFFLAGLVVLGGQQQWWLQEVLMSMGTTSVYFGATALTAVTDNAALTYLGSLVEGLTDEFKYALVSGAVSGGGLTVIANAPNPAGFSILKGNFANEAILAPWLFLSALGPTLVTVVAFYFL